MRGRWLLYVALTFGLAYGSPTRLARSVPGDPGDSHLILALLEWGGDRSMRLFQGYWDGPMFSTGRDVMAYTDTFLPLTVPFHLLATISGSEIVAFNLLYVLSWVFCAEATHRLALRVGMQSRAAAIVAVAFTFSTIRLAGSNHFQLAWAGFIPLTFLAVCRFRERPTPLRGIALALTIVAGFLTSAYYGVFLVIGAGAIVGWGLLGDLRRREWRPALAGHATLGAAVAVMLLPIQHWYDSAKACTYGREFDAGALALRPGNLLSASRRATLIGDVPIISDPSLAQSGENHAYVGAVVLVGLVALVAVGVARRRPPEGLRRTGPLTAVWAVGLGTAAIAVGPLSTSMPVPYDLAAEVLPGIDAMLALARLAIFLQLALCLTAGIGIDAMLDRLGTRSSWAVMGVLVAVISVEGLMQHPMLEVVEPPDGSVYEVLADLDGGVAVELPAPPRTTVSVFAFIESTRMARGTDDEIQTVNGYSGYAPAGYDQSVDRLNTFPSSEAVRELRRLGVDHVVLHTARIDTGNDEVSELIEGSGFARYDTDRLGEVLRGLPSRVIEERIDASDGVVLVLTPGPEKEPASACDAG